MTLDFKVRTKSFIVRAKKGNNKVKKKYMSLFEKQLFASGSQAGPVTGESTDTSKSCRNLREVPTEITSVFVWPTPQPHPNPHSVVSSNGSKTWTGWWDLCCVWRRLRIYTQCFTRTICIFSSVLCKEDFLQKVILRLFPKTDFKSDKWNILWATYHKFQWFTMCAPGWLGSKNIWKRLRNTKELTAL